MTALSVATADAAPLSLALVAGTSVDLSDRSGDPNPDGVFDLRAVACGCAEGGLKLVPLNGARHAAPGAIDATTMTLDDAQAMTYSDDEIVASAGDAIYVKTDDGAKAKFYKFVVKSNSDDGMAVEFEYLRRAARPRMAKPAGH